MFKKIFFLGTPQFSANIFEDLIKQEIVPSGIITMPDKAVGRGQHISETAVKKIAIQYNVKVFQPATKDDLEKVLKAESPDALVVIAYGMIFTKEIVDNYLLLNIHTSILPKYRGPSPIQSAILNGDAETGVTLMKIAYEIDNGDIIDIKRTPILLKDNLQTLAKKLEKLSVEILLENFSKPFDLWQYQKQDEKDTSFTRKIKKEDGLIDLAKTSPETIIRKLRAFNPWPGVYIIKNDKRIKIIDAKIDAGALQFITVQPEGKKAMSYSAYVNGFGQLL